MAQQDKLTKLTLRRNGLLNSLLETAGAARKVDESAELKLFFIARATDADDTYKDFKIIHNQIIGLIDEDAFDTHDDVRRRGEVAYFNAKAILHQITSPPPSTEPSTKPVASPKLTKITLPVFSGDYKSWPSFYDLYRTLVHDNDTLSDVAKYQYLLTSLSGEPLHLIKGLPMTNANYPIAFETLKNRYQNKRHLATIYYNEIQGITIKHEGSSKAYRLLIDTFSENVEGLRTLGFPVDSWDFLLFNILLQKLDNSIKTKFEVEHSSFEIPTYEQLIGFLENQSKALDSVKLTSFGKGNKMSTKPFQSSFTTEIKSKINCILCHLNHNLYQCDKFLEKTPSQRFEIISSNKFCKNCLGYRHITSQCNSTRTCRICRKHHHTLLHLKSHSQETNSADVSLPIAKNTVAAITHTFMTVLLPVAELDIQDRFGRYHRVRALIDSCSMVNFITEKLQKRLQLVTSIRSIPIEGLNNMSSTCNKGSAECYVKPCDAYQPTLQFKAVISQRICSSHPTVTIDASKYSHLQDLILHEGQTSPGPIDLLLGAEVVPYILTGDRRVGALNEPAALGSIFGWLLMGNSTSLSYPTPQLSLLIEPSTDFCLQRFWELEQIKEIPPLTAEDTQCENHFVSTYSRTIDGRFMVSLPFKTSGRELGESYSQALRRFLYLEKRLIKNSENFNKYKEFMRDYLSKGHMSPIGQDDCQNQDTYYIPHHYVLTSSKFRVVFDASAKTTSGKSLNDVLIPGPKLQNDLCSILLKFRCYPIAFICDIQQMYRQILVTPDQRNYQRIISRDYQSGELAEYKLNTVTYGVSSAPYLALRTIHELARLNAIQFPDASRALLHDMYVDDVVTGSFSVRDALNLQNDIIKLLSSGGFQLAKWASNEPELLKFVSAINHGKPVSLENKEDGFVKVLGLHWEQHSDNLGFSYQARDNIFSKRNILSNIARIFDPLGLITPCILAAKCLMQRLWLEKLEWDDLPSEEIRNYWIQYQLQLPLLSQLRIPRLILPARELHVELHMFCDASSVGYCAVAYLRSVLPNSNVNIKLICAKSRVAPLRTTSLPRLELCGACLLADMAKFVLSSISSVVQPQIFAWTDSMVVLHWLNSSPHRWKTFVANRTSHVQNIIPADRWRHISSADNPADPGSRGLLPSEMLTCGLWWHGPSWLALPPAQWPSQVPVQCDGESTLEEKRMVSINVAEHTEDNFLLTLMDRFSDLSKIQNIISYILRFVSGCSKENNHSNLTISTLEKQAATHLLARHVQSEHFSQIINLIRTGKTLPKQFRKLSPFIGQDQLLRVGGRLRNADIHYDAKHPILLPAKNRLSELIVENLHRQHLHPGYRSLSAIIANQFWILSPRSVIYRVISRCIQCFKTRPKSFTPVMADLPTFRVQGLKAFSTVGIDYAGPFMTTSRKHRGAKTFKSYVCVFVCAATKAIHLELVSDLSTETFLAALRRFIARRGCCVRIFSDRGTNFVGAFNHMNHLAQEAGGKLGIEWLYSPPASPNFNGLSEAGVKSVKSHLQRVIGHQILTFEEFYTLLTQVESVLNSRPLYPISSDPNDLQPLTPGHFLLLNPLNTEIPYVDFQNIPPGRLSRWELIQAMLQHFWKRWSTEYLHTLQQRTKWTTHVPPLAPNTLVLIRNNNLPPLKWDMGRVIRCHPGSDGVVRVVTLRTTHGEIQRPVSKLCPLPTEI